MDSCLRKCVKTHLLFTANTSHSSFAVGKTTELSTQTCPRTSKVAHGRVLVSQNGQSSWSLWSVVVVSRCGQWFFVVSRSLWSVVFVVVVSLPRGQSIFKVNSPGLRDQSSWSVVVVSHCLWSSWSDVVVSHSSWMVFIFYGGYAHAFTETYGWGKQRSMSGQMYGGITSVGGHR